MDDLLAEFIAETREMLEATGGELVAWEADPADRGRLDAVFRFVCPSSEHLAQLAA